MLLYDTSPALHVSDAIYIHPQERHIMHLHVPAAGALYDAPEDGCILHPKHVEQGKCHKVTLNNLHQASLNKPIFVIRTFILK